MTDEFLCGYAAALAPIMRIFGESKLVVEVMKGDGVTLAMLQGAGVEEFDLVPIAAAHGAKPGVMDVFSRVARRELTPEEGARLLHEKERG